MNQYRDIILKIITKVLMCLAKIEIQCLNYKLKLSKERLLSIDASILTLTSTISKKSQKIIINQKSQEDNDCKVIIPVWMIELIHSVLDWDLYLGS